MQEQRHHLAGQQGKEFLHQHGLRVGSGFPAVPPRFASVDGSDREWRPAAGHMLCQDTARVQFVENHAVVRARAMQEQRNGQPAGRAAVGGSGHGQ